MWKGIDLTQRIDFVPDEEERNGTRSISSCDDAIKSMIDMVRADH